MKVEKIKNVTIHYDKEVWVKNNTIMGEDKFKITLIIDNVTLYYNKLYKVTVGSIPEKEGDILITIYSELTRISSNMVVPSNKELLIIVNDSYW